jgi:hypothetical protein
VITLRLLVILLALAFLSSCGQRGSTSQMMELEFEVDTTLIARQVIIDTALSIVFQPPKKWVSSAFDAPEVEGVFPDQFFEIRHLFINPDDSSSMLITRMKGFTHEQLVMLRVDHQRILGQNNLWSDIRHATFRFNDFVADQFLMQNNDMVNFKLILTSDDPVFGDEIISLDYFLPRSHYVQNIKSVESSIGSLLLFN